MKSIPVEYLKGKTRTEQAELKRLWKVKQAFLDALKEVIERKLNESDYTSKEDYHLSAWPYLRADTDGYRRALRDIYNLLP